MSLNKRGLIRSKRGLSEVVTIGLIILLAIAAVVIVWSFVRPAITGVGEKISGECLTLDIKPTSCNLTATISEPGYRIKVERGRGNEELVGIKLVFENAVGETSVVNSAGIMPSELEKNTIWNATAVAVIPTKVKIAGVVKISGKDTTCSLSVGEKACTS